MRTVLIEFESDEIAEEFMHTMCNSLDQDIMKRWHAKHDSSLVFGYEFPNYHIKVLVITEE